MSTPLQHVCSRTFRTSLAQSFVRRLGVTQFFLKYFYPLYTFWTAQVDILDGLNKLVGLDA